MRRVIRAAYFSSLSAATKDMGVTFVPGEINSLAALMDGVLFEGLSCLCGPRYPDTGAINEWKDDAELGERMTKHWGQLEFTVVFVLSTDDIEEDLKITSVGQLRLP